MSGLIALGVLVGICALLWYVRKAGADSARRKAAEEALRDVVEATKPITDAERERVRREHQRD